jgi:hypothetical protein
MPNGNDEIVLTISWEGAAPARLHLLLDNAHLIATEADALDGVNEIHHRYRTNEAVFHVIEWSLRFEGATLHNLIARASVNGAAPTTLDAHPGDQPHIWASRGAAP